MRVAALSAAAARAGLVPGTPLAEARARFLDLTVLPMDRAADAALLRLLAAAAEIFTPLVALDGASGLIADITGCVHLFGGEEEMARRAVRRFQGFGLLTRASVADTPDAAHALVRFGKGGIVPEGGGEALARRLPVAALEAEAATTLALERAGLALLGDLADRPSALLTARFGSDLSARLRRILGHEDVRVTPLRPSPVCLAERHFAEPILDTTALDAALNRLAADVCDALERRGEGGRRFEVSLYRCDGLVRRLAVETHAPSREPATILRLMRLRLDGLADPLDPGFGFDALRLAVPEVEAMAERQVSLDARAEDERAFSALIDRLVVRFGRERVLRFFAEDSHAPERAGGLMPVAETGASLAFAVPEADEPPLRPLQLFAVPQPIEAIAEVPDGPPLRFRWRRVLHEVARAEGPERIAPEWWMAGAAPDTRDYYRIEDALGRRFWVFREGLYGADARPRWYVHGLFP
jgi:protein ImuB